MPNSQRRKWRSEAQRKINFLLQRLLQSKPGNDLSSSSSIFSIPLNLRTHNRDKKNSLQFPCSFNHHHYRTTSSQPSPTPFLPTSSLSPTPVNRKQKKTKEPETKKEN